MTTRSASDDRAARVAVLKVTGAAPAGGKGAAPQGGGWGGGRVFRPGRLANAVIGMMRRWRWLWQSSGHGSGRLPPHAQLEGDHHCRHAITKVTKGGA